MWTFDENYCLEQFRNLLAIDSTTGKCREIENYIIEQIKEMGFPYHVTHKGGVLADLGGEGNDLVINAHLDDIGLMVRKINADGTLQVCSVGGLYPFYSVTENVRIYTRDDKVYTGTICRTPNSVHLTEEELRLTLGEWRKNVCIVLDAPVKTAADVKALGIDWGDMIALDTRLVETNGYIKSRFIDDKMLVAILLTAMKYISDNKIALNRKCIAYFSEYEEIGHGTSWLPEGVKDMIALDIAPIGPDNQGDEQKVSIFAKDSRFPYHWEMTNELRAVAIENGIDFVMDMMTPHYGTDADCSLTAGHDIRHVAYGPGTANSHGYERTHIDGVKNTYDLTMAYMLK